MGLQSAHHTAAMLPAPMASPASALYGSVTAEGCTAGSRQHHGSCKLHNTRTSCQKCTMCTKLTYKLARLPAAVLPGGLPKNSGRRCTAAHSAALYITPHCPVLQLDLQQGEHPLIYNPTIQQKAIERRSLP
jgi:hypothetical protein